MIIYFVTIDKISHEKVTKISKIGYGITSKVILHYQFYCAFLNCVFALQGASTIKLFTAVIVAVS